MATGPATCTAASSASAYGHNDFEHCGNVFAMLLSTNKWTGEADRGGAHTRLARGAAASTP